jgi:hypothetical protein
MRNCVYHSGVDDRCISKYIMINLNIEDKPVCCTFEKDFICDKCGKPYIECKETGCSPEG